MKKDILPVRFGPPEMRGLKGWTPYTIQSESHGLVTIKSFGVIPYMRVSTYVLESDWQSVKDPYATRPSRVRRITPTQVEIEGIGQVEEDGNMVIFQPSRGHNRMYTKYPREELRDIALSGMLHLGIAMGRSGG